MGAAFLLESPNVCPVVDVGGHDPMFAPMSEIKVIIK